MSVIIVLLIISLLIAGGFLLAFMVSAKNGQFDDDYTPSVRILFDDELSSNEEKTNQNNT